MSSLITTLRGFCNAGTADFTVGSSTFFSDDQLQTTLDRYATPVREEPLDSYPVTTGGTVNWLEYQSSNRFFEDTSGGTARFIVKDSTGSVQGTANWSADYEKGIVTFGTNQGGTIYNLTGYSYDVYAAAADVWYQKAAHAAEQIDFATTVHKITRNHVTAQCMSMARRFESMATTTVTSGAVIARGDMA